MLVDALKAWKVIWAGGFASASRSALLLLALSLSRVAPLLLLLLPLLPLLPLLLLLLLLLQLQLLLPLQMLRLWLRNVSHRRADYCP